MKRVNTKYERNSCAISSDSFYLKTFCFLCFCFPHVIGVSLLVLDFNNTCKDRFMLSVAESRASKNPRLRPTASSSHALGVSIRGWSICYTIVIFVALSCGFLLRFQMISGRWRNGTIPCSGLQASAKRKSIKKGIMGLLVEKGGLGKPRKYATSPAT